MYHHLWGVVIGMLILVIIICSYIVGNMYHHLLGEGGHRNVGVGDNYLLLCRAHVPVWIYNPLKHSSTSSSERMGGVTNLYQRRREGTGGEDYVARVPALHLRAGR